MIFKKDKHIMYEEEEWTVEGEWLNGVPHGVCIFDYERKRGVITFTHGKIQGGPWWAEYKDSGSRISVEDQHNDNVSGLKRFYSSDN